MLLRITFCSECTYNEFLMDPLEHKEAIPTKAALLDIPPGGGETSQLMSADGAHAISRHPNTRLKRCAKRCGKTCAKTA